MHGIIQSAVFLLGGYLLGSIPFGLILSRMAGLGDVRKIGSGNIGATNVLRTGNKKIAAATLLLDLGKGFLAVFIAHHWEFLPNGAHMVGLTALGAVLGHCFPVWLRFKGGKGVATAAGVCFGLAWPIGLAYAALWIGMLALLRISSVGGMSAAIAAPIAAYALGYQAYFPFLIVIAAIVIWLHRTNIARLTNGTEPKFGGSKKG